MPNVYPANPPNLDLSITKPVAEQLAVDISNEMNARIAADNVLRGMIEDIEVPESGIGVAGYNLYLSSLNSDIATYKKLNLVSDDAEVEVPVVANNNTVYGPSYVMDQNLGLTEIPAGEWAFSYYRKISNAALISVTAVQVFLRHAGGTETVVASFESPEIENTTYEQRLISYVLGAISAVATDRLGIRVGLRTTRSVETTLTYIVGDGRGFFMRTPLNLVHNNLAGRDATDAHPQASITGLVSALASKADASATTSALALKAPIASPTFTGTVSGITKAMVGLGNVDNTSDASKPVSTATQTALNLKADLASPTFTGTPLTPTAVAGTNTTQIASTAFVRGEITALVDSAPSTLDTLNELAAALGDDPNFATTVTTALGLKAPLASPALTGTPTAPTASTSTDTTQLATTAFVQALVLAVVGSPPMYLANSESVKNTNGVVAKTISGMDGTPILANTAATYYDMTLPRALLPNEVAMLQARNIANKAWVNVAEANVTSLKASLARTLTKGPSSTAGQIFGMQLEMPSSGVVRVQFMPSCEAVAAYSDSDMNLYVKTWAQIIAAADGYDAWRVRIGT